MFEITSPHPCAGMPRVNREQLPLSSGETIVRLSARRAVRGSVASSLRHPGMVEIFPSNLDGSPIMPVMFRNTEDISIIEIV